MTSSTTLPPLPYSKLDPNNSEIRVIHLDPNPDPEATIKCSLVKVSLRDKPGFTALSYAWGDPTAVQHIEVDQHQLQVPASAWQALKALRYPGQKRILWVDAICINQKDLEERTSQVKLMGDVYRTTESVRVWLGLPDDGNDGTGKSVKSDYDNQGGRAAKEDESDGSDAESDQPQLDAVTILREMTTVKGVGKTLELGKASQKRTKVLERFFSRPWWERLWVVQEIALGRNVVFQQGAMELTYEELLDAYGRSAKFLRENLNGYQYGSFSGQAVDFMEIFASVRVLEQTRQLFAKQTFTEESGSWDRYATMTWATVVNLLQNRKATVDVDRLYSLYGLLPPTMIQGQGMKPSYTLNTEDAFVEVTHSIIQSTGSLMMFNFLNRAGEKDSKEPALLPSWVPDWRRAPLNKYEATLGVAREKMFNASAGSAPLHVRRLSSNTLCLKGYFVDIVHYYSECPIFPSMSPALQGVYGRWREVWEESSEGKPRFATYARGEPRENAFQRTVLLDCEPVGGADGGLRRLTPEERKAMFDAHDHATEVAFADDMSIAGERLKDDDARRTDYMMNCVKSRSFFATSLQLIGLGASNMKAGDHIFIVEGNRHPVLLRPSKKYADTWQAVSECYVHSIMDGEADGLRDICANIKKGLDAQESLQELKGTERNPRWDEVTEKLEGAWTWLLIE